jgi:hypothetical protein
MTVRTVRRPVVDFTRLSCARARERVRELVALGLAESTVGDLVGWDLNSVRRACAERSPPAVLVDERE